MTQGPALPYIVTSGHPHLQVFHPHHGVRTIPLKAGSQSLGASPDTDITLPGEDMAPRQLNLTLGGEKLSFENLSPDIEVRFNHSKNWNQELQPGDQLYIGQYRLLFRVKRKTPVDKRQKFVESFSFLPPSLQLRYRPIDLPSHFLSHQTHTLHIHHGGILIPTWVEPPNQPRLSTMEIELRLPKRGRRMVFGQVHENLLHKNRFMMLVQLHQTDRQTYEHSMQHAFRAAWITPAPHKIPKAKAIQM